MALESASYISGLNPAWPAGSDSYHQGDDHIRLIKSVLRTTFPNITGPVTATQAQLNGAGSSMPSGSRIPFFASAAPVGWTRVDNVYSCLMRLMPNQSSGGSGRGSHDPEYCHYVVNHIHVTSGYTSEAPHPIAPYKMGAWEPRMVDMILCQKT